MVIASSFTVRHRAADGTSIVMEVHRRDDGVNEVRSYEAPAGTTEADIEASMDAYAAEINARG